MQKPNSSDNPQTALTTQSNAVPDLAAIRTHLDEKLKAARGAIEQAWMDYQNGVDPEEMQDALVAIDDQVTLFDKFAEEQHLVIKGLVEFSHEVQQQRDALAYELNDLKEDFNNQVSEAVFETIEHVESCPDCYDNVITEGYSQEMMETSIDDVKEAARATLESRLNAATEIVQHEIAYGDLGDDDDDDDDEATNDDPDPDDLDGEDSDES